MKKVGYLGFVLITFLLFSSNIEASNKINSIDVDAYINKDGSANITEVWNMYVDEGTEVYKPMGDLGNSNITDFKVVDEQMNVYTYTNNWNTSLSLEGKKYKNGFNTTSDGIELCWGMSSYGSHVYTVTYKVSNFIFNVSDAQVVYWKFINDSMNPYPKNISINIESYYSFPDTLEVWGYGYEGYAYVDGGKVELASKENTFKSSHYIVGLIKFPLNTFDNTNTYSNVTDFNSVLTMAEEGASSTSNFFTKIIGFISQFIYFIPFIVIFFAARSSKKSNILYLFKNKNTRIKNSEVNNFRDIPCNKDLFRANTVAKIFSLNQKKNETNIIGAILLKWILNDEVSIVNLPDKAFKKNRTGIDLKNGISTSNESELELYEIMKEASKDGILGDKELEKWCKKNYSELFNWIDNLNVRESDKLVNENLLTAKKRFLSSAYYVEDALKSEGLQLAGLKNFLKEFSQINEKQPIEVKLWREYLIYAQIFGMADKVAKQFKNLYPEIYEIEGTNFDDNFITNIILINAMTSRSINYAERARDAAARAYSSGGGGYSSFGGGGGSFGGGSGGGCR